MMRPVGAPTAASPSQGTTSADSLLDRVDPRARVLAALAVATVVVLLSDLVALTLAAALSLGLMRLTRMPSRQTLRRMAAADGFIIVMLLMLPFTVPGDPMLEVFGYAATWQGARQAIEIALKANVVILTLMCLVGTMETVTLGHALHRLRLPPGFVQLLLLTTRYIDVVQQECSRLRAAMICRGFRHRNSLHSYRTFGYLIGIMLVRAVERSERVLDAMKCRGFSGRLPLLAHGRYGTIDRWFGLATLVVVILLAAIEVARAAAV